jgi:hypothetical protein
MQQLQAQVLGRSGNLAPEVLQRAIQLGMGTGLHTDAAVENLLVKYENAEMIADMVMPVINRPKRSDFFRKMKPEIAFNIPDAKIASAEAMPNRANATLDTNGTYTVKDYGLMDFISADEEANADAPLEPRMESEEALMGYLMLAREKRAADVVFASGNYGSNTAALSGTDRWDNASSDPVAKILAVKKTPLVAPNTMVIGYEAWDYLRTNTNFMAYVRSRAQAGGSSTPLLIDEATVCRAFDLDRVVIGKAKYNSAREGATASYSYIWGKSCALIRVEPRPSVRKTQTFGYTFRYTAGGIPPFGVQVIANQLAGVRGGSFIKVGHSDDEVLVAGSNAGYLLTTAIS